MGHFLGVTILVLFSNTLIAQSGLFASYDCRSKSDWNYGKQSKEIALDFSDLDSIILAMRDQVTFDLFHHSNHKWKEWITSKNFDFGKDRGKMLMISDLRALHPYLRDKVLALIRICKSKGIELAVVETFRTHAKQHEYKSMGNRFTRSGAGKSNHQYGLAVDVVPIVNGKAEWHNLALWRRIGITGERLGLRWGGRWRRIFDPGHFEWTGGLSTSQLAQGYLPLVPRQQMNYPCLEEDLAGLVEHWSAWETEQGLTARSASN